ncbi:MAG TPA: hypothetical protein VNT51_03190 [Miltoncostaeaceae bacterium]|jgi:hypothetical protein|nr:hypothetical protein [Miltoncostaeaceae bacterium]
MAETPDAWAEITESVSPWMTPDWLRCAREFGSQPWVRLVLLVDAHALLSNPQATEKIAMTMSDLAEGREGERAGWSAINDSARDKRVNAVASLVDRAETVLSPELMVFFARSIEPLAQMHAR